MNNVLRLAAKRFYRFRFVHLLVSILVAAVVIVTLLYQGYLASLTENFAGRLQYPDLPGDVAVFLPGYATEPYISTPLTISLASWQLVTRHGQVTVAALRNSNLPTWPLPDRNEVWLPSSQRGQVYNEEIGDNFTFTRFTGSTLQQASLQVAGYYDDGGFFSPVLVNPVWALGWLGETADSTLITYPEAAYSTLLRRLSGNQGVRIVRFSELVHSAGYLVSSMYAGGNVALLLGIIFLAIGVAVFALLIFLDSRTELAILKTLGLKAGEAAGLLWVEFAIAITAGLLLGWAVLYQLAAHLSFPLTVAWPLLRFGLYFVTISYILALYIPTRLARVATVNELLLKRPILLWTKTIPIVSGRRPAYEDMLSRGWSCLELDREDDKFSVSIMPELGSIVREGELLAWQPIWFGLAEKRYLAPHAGIVQVIDPVRGLIAISKLDTMHVTEIQ